MIFCPLNTELQDGKIHISKFTLKIFLSNSFLSKRLTLMKRWKIYKLAIKKSLPFGREWFSNHHHSKSNLKKARVESTSSYVLHYSPLYHFLFQTSVYHEFPRSRYSKREGRRAQRSHKIKKPTSHGLLPRQPTKCKRATSAWFNFCTGQLQQHFISFEVQ